MKKKLLVASLCGLVLLTGGCAKIAKLENGKEVVASIDGYDITAEDLYEKLKEDNGAGTLVNLIDKFIIDKEIETTSDIKEYVDQQLNYIKAQYDAMGYDFTSELINAGYASEAEFKEYIMENRKKTLVAENYYKETLSEDAIKAYYEKEIYGEITAKHILIKPSEDTEEAEAEALKLANEVITKLNSGELSWADAVKEYSNDTASSSKEGLISSFTKQDVSDYGDDFFNSVLKLEDGKYTTTPVKSTYGYHIIMKVSQADKPSLEDATDTIKENLTDNAFSEDSNLAAKLWIKIREKYNLNIGDTVLNENYKTNIDSIESN